MTSTNTARDAAGKLVAGTAASKLAAAALTAATALSEGIATANTAKGKKLKSLFGPDADNTAATLAMRTARVMAGEAKLPTGGTGTKIGAVRKLVLAAAASKDTATAAAALTARGYVSAARVVLDKLAKDEADRREKLKGERGALSAKLNDRGAKKADRMVAAAKLTALDALDAKGKHAAAVAALTSAIETAKGKGITATAIGELLESIYVGASVTVKLPTVAAA